MIQMSLWPDVVPDQEVFSVNVPPAKMVGVLRTALAMFE